MDLYSQTSGIRNRVESSDMAVETFHNYRKFPNACQTHNKSYTKLNFHVLAVFPFSIARYMYVENFPTVWKVSTWLSKLSKIIESSQTLARHKINHTQSKFFLFWLFSNFQLHGTWCTCMSKISQPLSKLSTDVETFYNYGNACQRQNKYCTSYM